MAAPPRAAQTFSSSHLGTTKSGQRSTGMVRHEIATGTVAAVAGRPATFDPWQRAAYDDWAARLGIDRMDDVLRALHNQLRDLLPRIIDADRATLRLLAHDAASTAGTLGFLDVTHRYRALIEARDESEETLARAALGGAIEAAVERLSGYFAVQAAAAAA